MIYFKDHCQSEKSNMKIPATLDLVQVFYKYTELRIKVKLFVFVAKFPHQIGLYHLRGINFNKSKHNTDFHSRTLLNTGILARKSQR
jgi:hypothetical protein